jgi:hypothetical protein
VIGMLPGRIRDLRWESGSHAFRRPSVEEMFLTAVQSLFTVAILANLSFSLMDAGALSCRSRLDPDFTDPQFRFL